MAKNYKHIILVQREWNSHSVLVHKSQIYIRIVQLTRLYFLQGIFCSDDLTFSFRFPCPSQRGCERELHVRYKCHWLTDWLSRPAHRRRSPRRSISLSHSYGARGVIENSSGPRAGASAAGPQERLVLPTVLSRDSRETAGQDGTTLQRAPRWWLLLSGNHGGASARAASGRRRAAGRMEGPAPSLTPHAIENRPTVRGTPACRRWWEWAGPTVAE